MWLFMRSSWKRWKPFETINVDWQHHIWLYRIYHRLNDTCTMESETNWQGLHHSLLQTKNFINLYLYLSSACVIFMETSCLIDNTVYSEICRPANKTLPLLVDGFVFTWRCRCIGFIWQGFGSRGGCRGGLCEKRSGAAPMSDSQFQPAPRRTHCWPKLS